MRSSALLLLLALAAVGPARAQTSGSQDSTDEPVRLLINLSLVPHLSIGDVVAEATGRPITNVVALNLLGGRAARLAGVELSGLWGTYTADARGAQLAGAAAIVGADMRGTQVGGFAGIAGGSLHGVQAAGFASIAGAEVRGLQAAGFASIAGGDAAGQAAGFVSIAGAGVGGQVAGFVSIAGSEVRGLQASGFTSITGGSVGGLQAAGFANVAGGRVRGAQVAGFVNVAPDVSGLQVGIVNVARSHSGVPLGLVSYVGEVGLQVDVGMDELGTLAVALRSGSRRVKNYVGLGGRPLAGGEARWSTSVGLGVVLAPAARLAAEPALFFETYYADDLKALTQFTSALRVTANAAVGHRAALYAGPALRLYYADDAAGSDLPPYTLYERTPGDGYLALWVGGAAGVRIAL